MAPHYAIPRGRAIAKGPCQLRTYDMLAQLEMVEVNLTDVRFLYACKEPISLEHEDFDGEEKVDYEANTDAYFIEPDDTGFEGNVGGSLYMTANDEPK
ncbi:uncharacterized protein A4U43_C02F14690 [Asparagus officinalis]|uniref:Uncharacterized protein n=1 Tax=Asparagus officinalis TaxID=4686 RepID=A0A5P1FK87_ASPOF|nr:uncharacterized protein A4U43_C02F14690 [Asparagus officinalis]